MKLRHIIYTSGAEKGAIVFQQAEKEVCSILSNDTKLEAMLAGERKRLVGFCAHLTGNLDVAEDLAQETLLEAWRNQHKLRDQDDIEGWTKWLSAIARNVCMRWSRSHGRDSTHLASFKQYEDETELTIEDVAADDYDVEIELEREELARLLDQALALLPPMTRDVLIERYIYESSHAEIAEHLGLNEDALVQRLYRGKLALRRVITTSMSKEAEAYGISVPDEERLQQETHIWCPMCSKSRLTKYYNPSTNRTGFFCSNCWHIASMLSPQIWSGVSSPKAILARQLAWLGDHYWQAINIGQVSCDLCGGLAHAEICCSQNVPEYLIAEEQEGYYGVYITCTICHDAEFNPLPHLTLDTPEARQFWRKHPRMIWLPGSEIEYEGHAALVGSFQSVTESAQLDVIYQRETLKVLGVHEHLR